jgi:hypothetical protein
MDLDGNGLVEYSEFSAACLDSTTYTKQAAGRAIFRLLDRDGDGLIGESELTTALGYTEAEEVGELLRDADADNDGYIGSEDFHALLTSDGEEVSYRLYDAGDIHPVSTAIFSQSPTKDRFNFSDITRKASDRRDSPPPAQ